MQSNIKDDWKNDPDYLKQVKIFKELLRKIK
jgi:hypothetical protein